MPFAQAAPTWALPAAILLLLGLAAALTAAILQQRNATRNADQLAGQLHLLANLGNAARNTETMGAAILAEAGNRLETILAQTEALLREDGAALQTGLRQLEQEGGNAAALTAQLEQIARQLPEAATLQPAAPSPAILEQVAGELGRLAVTLEAREAATSATLQAVRESQERLPESLALIPGELTARLAQNLASMIGTASDGMAESVAVRIVASIQAMPDAAETHDTTPQGAQAAATLPAHIDAALRGLDDLHSRILQAGEALAPLEAAPPLAAVEEGLRRLTDLQHATEATAARLVESEAEAARVAAPASVLAAQLAAMVQDSAQALGALTAAGNRSAAQTGAANAALESAAARLENIAAAVAMLGPTLDRAIAGTAAGNATLTQSAASLTGTIDQLAALTPILAGLPAPFHALLESIPRQLGAALAEAASAQRAASGEATSASHSLGGTALAALDHAAARVDAALAVLPAAVDTALKNATFTLQAIAEARQTDETAIGRRLDQLAIRLETLCADLAAKNAATAAAVAARLAQLESLDRGTQDRQSLAEATQSLEALLVRQDHAAASVHLAARELADAAGRTLLQGAAQQQAADRLLAAAEAVDRATPPRRQGLAAIPGVAAECRALAAGLGGLARAIAGGAAPAPAGFSGEAPALVAALQRGAEDLREAAAAIAMVKDALPDAA